MKTRTRKPVVEITCELAFSDGHPLTHAEAEVIVKVLRTTVAEVFPHKVRACWVSRGLRFLGIPIALSRAREDLSARIDELRADLDALKQQYGELG